MNNLDRRSKEPKEQRACSDGVLLRKQVAVCAIRSGGGVASAHRVAVWTTVCAIGIAAGGGRAAEDVRVDSVLAKAAMVWQRIHSIQFTSTTDWNLAQTLQAKFNAKGTHFLTTAVFMEQNGRFRSDGESPDLATGKTEHKAFLYDGSKYQFYDRDNRVLSQSQRSGLPNPTFAMNPLLAPYMFILTVPGTLAASELRSPKVWEKLAEAARWYGKGKDGEHDCDVIEFPVAREGRSFRYRVYFAEDLDYLPVRTELRDDQDKLYGISRTTGVRKIESEGGSIVIATDCAIEDYDGEGRVLQKLRLVMKEGTVKVNESIPAEMFSLPITGVGSFIDTDTGIGVNLDERLNPEHIEDVVPANLMQADPASNKVSPARGGPRVSVDANACQARVGSTSSVWHWIALAVCLMGAVVVAAVWAWRSKSGRKPGRAA